MPDICCAQKKGNKGRACTFPSVSTFGFERKGNDHQTDKLFLLHLEIRGGTRALTEDVLVTLHFFLSQYIRRWDKLLDKHKDF